MAEVGGFSHISGHGSYHGSTASSRLESFQLNRHADFGSSCEPSGLEKLCSGAAWVARGVGKFLLGVVLGSIALTLTVGLLACVVARLAIGLAASIVGFIPGLGDHFLEPIIGKLGALPCGLGAAICGLGLTLCVAPFATKHDLDKFVLNMTVLVNYAGSYTTWVEAAKMKGFSQ